MRNKTIHVNNIDIWTEIYGNENSSSIILIAGAMAPAVFYPTVFCEKLAGAGFRVIRFDNRDIGFSTHFPSAKNADDAPPYSIYDMVEDVNGVLIIMA